MATSSRYPGGAVNDNTDRIRTNEVQAPVYASSIAITTTKSCTVVNPAVLTGALSLTIGVGGATTPPYAGDTVEFLFLSDGTGRVVTFSTGFATSGTLTLIASKRGSASFMFDGEAWVETGRGIQA